MGISFPLDREKLRQILYSDRVEAFIVAMIVINAAVLGALTYEMDAAKDINKINWLVAIDQAILAIFICEMIIKLSVDGWRFFKSGWNVFDLLIISVSILGNSYPLTIFRSLRVLRALRIVTLVPSMRVVVESFLRSLPGIGSVLMVMLLVLFVYAVIGTTLFYDVAPELFGSLETSSFTLFTVLTLEGWPDVAREVMAERPWAWTYFVSYVSINSFAVLNLLIAVIITAMQRDYEADAEEEREDIKEELLSLHDDVRKMMAQMSSTIETKDEMKEPSKPIEG